MIPCLYKTGYDSIPSKCTFGCLYSSFLDRCRVKVVKELLRRKELVSLFSLGNFQWNVYGRRVFNKTSMHSHTRKCYSRGCRNHKILLFSSGDFLKLSKKVFVNSVDINPKFSSLSYRT